MFIVFQLFANDVKAISLHQADSLYNQALLQMQQNEVTNALILLKEIELEYKTDSLLHQKITFAKAEAYNTLGDYQSSLVHLFSLLESVGISAKSKFISDVYNRIGTIDIELKDYSDGVEYLKKAIELMPDNYQGSSELAGYYNNMGIAHHKMCNYSRALRSYHKALDIFSNLNNHHGIVLTKVNIGIIHFKQNDFHQAKNEYLQALVFAKESPVDADLPLVYINLGKVYREINDFNKSHEYTTIALVISKRIEARRLERKCLYELFLLNEKMGKWDLALNFYKSYSQINDSIYNDEMLGKFVEMQTRFETHQKEIENNALKRQQILQDERIATQHKLLWSTILLVIIVSVFAFVFLLQKKKLLSAYKDILKRNLEIVNSENYLREAKKKLEQELIKTQTEDNSNIEKRYVGSSLNNNKKEILYSQIVQLVEHEKLFCNSELSTSMLAEKLKTNKNYISQVINEFTNNNFSNFINEYRIKEARQLLSDQKNSKFTIEAIGNNVGFHSKTSFYQAFKKYTGLTPSFYIDNINKL